MVTPQLELAEQLLERLLCGDVMARARAYGEALNADLGGLTVVDEACHDDHGRPLVLPLSALFAHLRRLDPLHVVEDRGGIRLHTPANVRFGDAEEGGRGPALGMAGERTYGHNGGETP